MAVHVPGLVAILLFYLLILLVGVIASWWKRRKMRGRVSAEDAFLTGGRELGYFVGIFTMTATWVGGGYINATVETIYNSGMVWCQIPFGYAASLIIDSFLFAKKFREARYTTMIDPFQLRFGRISGGLAYLPALMGELFWSAAIIRTLGLSLVLCVAGAQIISVPWRTPLGAAMSLILGLDMWLCVIISTAVAVSYTLFGGLFSVAFTDVVQLLCILLGMIISIPFIWRHDAIKIDDNPPIQYSEGDWRGVIAPNQIGLYIDDYLLLIFGGIPWQVYFQRCLAAKSVRVAQVLSFFGGIGCVVLSIPSIVLGIVARYTDWSYLPPEAEAKVRNDTSFILPAMITYLTPPVVSFIGLGAVAAAVMSSSDSSLLSSSCMMANNVWKGIVHRDASKREVLWVWRVSVVLFGACGAAIGIEAENVYSLFYLCSDFVYVVLFPLLFLVVYAPFVNRIGYLAGFAVSLLLRLLSGESAFHIPCVIQWPMATQEPENYACTQRVPYRTFCAIINFIVTILVSLIAAKVLPQHVTRAGVTWENAVDMAQRSDAKKAEKAPSFVYRKPIEKGSISGPYERKVEKDGDPNYEVHELRVNYD